MEENTKHTFFKANTTFALFMGLSFIAASYTFYKTGWGVSSNPQLSNITMLLTIAGCFIGVRKYRDESLKGALSYAGALGICMYLITVAAIIHGIFIYYLYRNSPALLADFTQVTQANLTEFYKNSPLKEDMMRLVEIFTTPGVIMTADIFSKILSGFIFSLFLAGLLRSKAYPRSF